MRFRRLLAQITMTFALVAAFGAFACGDDGYGDTNATETPGGTSIPVAATSEPSGETMTLSSSAFADNEAIPVVYTCDGGNTSPPLTIDGVPSTAITLALVMNDPDASSAGFVHWTIWNIDPTVTEVAEGAPPRGGNEGLNGAGRPGYAGPCPPSGTHQYVFTLYALDGALALDDATSGKTELEAAIEGRVLATAELTGTYGR